MLMTFLLTWAYFLHTGWWNSVWTSIRTYLLTQLNRYLVYNQLIHQLGSTDSSAQPKIGNSMAELIDQFYGKLLSLAFGSCMKSSLITRYMCILCMTITIMQTWINFKLIYKSKLFYIILYLNKTTVTNPQ